MQVPPDDVFASKMDGKGRVTIPAARRDKWGLGRGDRVEVALVGSESSGFECDDCGEDHDITEVLVLNRGTNDERVVCADCSGVEDRIVGP